MTFYEYTKTTGPRKSWDNPDEPPYIFPNDENQNPWELDPDRGRPGESWERFDYHEERYWRRVRPPTVSEFMKETTGISIDELSESQLRQIQYHQAALLMEKIAKERVPAVVVLAVPNLNDLSSGFQMNLLVQGMHHISADGLASNQDKLVTEVAHYQVHQLEDELLHQLAVRLKERDEELIRRVAQTILHRIGEEISYQARDFIVSISMNEVTIPGRPTP
jgi:hypothetical protein